MREIGRIRSIDAADVVALGYGKGRPTRKLARMARSVHACDGSRLTASVARRLYAGTGPGDCTFAVADHRSIPLEHAAADVVIAAWTVLSPVMASWEHDWRVEPDRCVTETRRLLKSGGAGVRRDPVMVFPLTSRSGPEKLP